MSKDSLEFKLVKEEYLKLVIQNKHKFTRTELFENHNPLYRKIRTLEKKGFNFYNIQTKQYSRRYLTDAGKTKEIIKTEIKDSIENKILAYETFKLDCKEPIKENTIFIYQTIL